MKKVLLVIMALFVLSFNKVQASNLNNFSDDSKIISALSVLENIGSDDVFTRLGKSSTKIIFYDLTLISYSYAKHYAVSSTDENGNNYILINEKFRNAPKEAIACLIAHESVHQLPQATLEEEVKATTTEAQTWLKVKNSVSPDVSDALINRENKLANLYKTSTPSDNLIKDLIANNSFYQQQLAMN
jgi:hypothetical protein